MCLARIPILNTTMRKSGFEEPFDICIKNSGNVVHNYVDFLKEFQEVEIFEG